MGREDVCRIKQAFKPHAIVRSPSCGAHRLHAVQKERKHYHLDWSPVPDMALRYIKTRFPAAQAWQISATGTKDYTSREGIRVCPALVFLKRLV